MSAIRAVHMTIIARTISASRAVITAAIAGIDADADARTASAVIAATIITAVIRIAVTYRTPVISMVVTTIVIWLLISIIGITYTSISVIIAIIIIILPIRALPIRVLPIRVLIVMTALIVRTIAAACYGCARKAANDRAERCAFVLNACSGNIRADHTANNSPEQAANHLVATIIATVGVGIAVIMGISRNGY